LVDGGLTHYDERGVVGGIVVVGIVTGGVGIGIIGGIFGGEGVSAAVVFASVPPGICPCHRQSSSVVSRQSSVVRWTRRRRRRCRLQRSSTSWGAVRGCCPEFRASQLRQCVPFSRLWRSQNGNAATTSLGLDRAEF